MNKEQYHYVECGIGNIYLMNGYCWVDTPRGRGIVIEDLDGLHQAIGRYLIGRKKRLSGDELRFFRHELNLTQTRLGALLDVSDQTVARWEKGRTVVPGAADKMIRALYAEHIGAKDLITELLARLAESHESVEQTMSFEDTDAGWCIADAA